MKKLFITGVTLTFAILIAMAFTSPTVMNHPMLPQDQPAAMFPDDVAKIMETSCYDCHTDASSNTKAKLRLNFSKWSELSAAKKVGKMEAINDEIKKGGMPPAKYVEKYPDRALSADQKSLVDKWVADESKKLMGE
jgi:hypothetical protein